MENLLTVSGIAGCWLLIYSVLAFMVARIRRDNSVMDILYGPAFLFAALGTAFVTNRLSELPLLILLCIGLWATRLAIRIGRKNWNKPEDARYAAWRTEWLQRGRTYFILRSYLQVNALQCVIILFVLMPAIIAISFQEPINWWFAVAGLLVFLIGLSYETVADWQLDAFIKNKQAGRTRETLMTGGLFRYSRRPNYFGETLIWWGLAIMVLPLPYGWFAIVSPLLITFIVTKVTGPMLERQFLEKYPEAYRRYMETTNYFIPGRPDEGREA